MHVANKRDSYVYMAHTHTCTHNYTQSHTYTHKHTHTHINTHTHTHTHTHAWAHSDTLPLPSGVPYLCVILFEILLIQLSQFGTVPQDCWHTNLFSTASWLWIRTAAWLTSDLSFFLVDAAKLLSCRHTAGVHVLLVYALADLDVCTLL